MSDKINLKELREHTLRHLEEWPTIPVVDVPGSAVLALVEAVEAAHSFLDLDFGYLPAATQRALVPLLDALAHFDFSGGVS